ncbi:FAD-binding protein [Variovorax sp. J22R133]|uniref:FAD-binding protein n=1 Tax=Variovorax brevis TaxID=3053503 RepID=UPI0025775DB4|nr:FAD-binding protein [Variovorax sp. J22R133]MDM0110829.1 FAD-binding protein [Variovorax sp. J22R133]
MIWQNWAGNVTATPAGIHAPVTVEALCAVLAEARRTKQRVRVVGSGHSWSPLVQTSGLLISMANFAELSLDAAAGVLTLGSGVTVDQLAQFMLDRKVCVPSSVGIGLGEATMGGVFSTGCHGSGIDTPSVSDWIEGVELVTSQGELREYSLERDGDQVMNALRLSLGMLGIVTRYRIRVLPMFNVHVVEWKERVDTALAGVKGLVMDNDYAEVSWMPFNDSLWMQKANKTDLPVTRNSFAPPANAFRDRLYEFGSALALDAIESNPSLIPDVLRASFQMLDPGDYVSSITHYVHCADYGFFLDRYRLLDIEVVFDIDEEFDSVRRAFALTAAKVDEWKVRGQYPLNSTLGFRFIRNSDALLSSCRGNTRTCMAELFSYHKTPLFAEFAAEVLSVWMAELPRARTHWAKAFQYMPDAPTAMRKAFASQIDEFLAVRQQMNVDPDDLFVNEALGAIFGIH